MQWPYAGVCTAFDKSGWRRRLLAGLSTITKDESMICWNTRIQCRSGALNSLGIFIFIKVLRVVARICSCYGNKINYLKWFYPRSLNAPPPPQACSRQCPALGNLITTTTNILLALHVHQLLRDGPHFCPTAHLRPRIWFHNFRCDIYRFEGPRPGVRHHACSAR